MASPFTPNTDHQRRLMLSAIGAESLEDLFKDIPASHRNPRPVSYTHLTLPTKA